MEEIIRMLDHVYMQIHLYLDSKKATEKHKELIMRVLRHELDVLVHSIIEQVDELDDVVDVEE